MAKDLSAVVYSICRLAVLGASALAVVTSRQSVMVCHGLGRSSQADSACPDPASAYLSDNAFQMLAGLGRVSFFC